MNSTLTENEVLNFLEQIEQGEIHLTSSESSTNIYSGNKSYHASNGWKITIFIDAGEWDYIENIKSNDQRKIYFDGLDKMDRIRDYEPSLESIISKYNLDKKYNK